MVRLFRELHTHAAIFNPIKIARELWLDRFLILALVFFLSFELYVVIRATIAPISWLSFYFYFSTRSIFIFLFKKH